ncbi:hypothetical protein CYL31_09650 [Marinomonas sp. A3A]|uniref:hypothetical protein n=1 Tax=Marinomonas sp. A3A TaxID=2065312 RepID=UPI001BB3271B|nr:hypothetical protein [Marinomonas sp. A3A]QUX91661.1 hypothetical protein CYL31_09650 [Marinomonas sp. A3A]
MSKNELLILINEGKLSSVDRIDKGYRELKQLGYISHPKTKGIEEISAIEITDNGIKYLMEVLGVALPDDKRTLDLLNLFLIPNDLRGVTMMEYRFIQALGAVSLKELNSSNVLYEKDDRKIFENIQFFEEKLLA